MFKLSQGVWAKLLILVLLISPLPVGAEGSDPLAAYENRFFAHQFDQDSKEDRLVRLEKVIFGAAQSGDVDTRTRHLEQVLSVSAPAGQPQANADPGNATPGENTAQPKVKEATDYPAVTQLEQRVFRQAYPSEDVSKRLDRLEQSVFKQTYDELPMVDRVDQLTLKIIPESPLGVEEGASTTLPNKREDFAPTNLAVYSQITTLEEQILGKSFGGELVITRLSRMERKIFGGPQTGSIDSRMQRLSSRVAQQQTRALQTYGTTPRGNGPAIGSPTAQINSIMGSKNFSPELFQMMPNSVRQQFQSGLNMGSLAPSGGQPDSSQPTQDPSTPYSYSSPQSLYQNPGQITRRQSSQLYSGPSSYGVPQNATGYGQVMVPQQQTSDPDTDSIQSMGDPNNMGMGIPSQSPMGMQSMPNASPYQGNNPQMLQSLALLESQLLGRTFDGNNLMMRLNNLETQVFGMTYPQMSPQQRINRLMAQSTQQSYQGSPGGYPQAYPGYQQSYPGAILGRALQGTTAKAKSGSSGILGQALGAVMYGQMVNRGMINPAIQSYNNYNTPGYAGYGNYQPNQTQYGTQYGW